MLALLGQGLDQFRSRVAAQPGSVHRAEQEELENLLDEWPVVGVDGVLQPTVRHAPAVALHELTQQIRLRALEDLDVDALGHEFLAELLHQVGDPLHLLRTLDASVGTKEHGQALQQLQRIDSWLMGLDRGRFSYVWIVLNECGKRILNLARIPPEVDQVRDGLSRKYRRGKW